jgi:hypothetical protein
LKHVRFGPVVSLYISGVSGFAKVFQKRSLLEHPSLALFSATRTPIQNWIGFGRFVNPIATTSRAEAYQPTSLPFLATYHGRFRTIDRVRVEAYFSALMPRRDH